MRIRSRDYRLQFLSGFIISILLWGCGNTIALFDQYAYTQTTSIKIDVMNLMDKSNESYTTHLNDVNTVVSEVMKMKEYEKHRGNDLITYKMWNVLLDSTGQKGMIGKYLVKWKADDKEHAAFITDAKGLVSQGFDYIAELESKKLKSSDSNVQSFLTK
jgi:hypothetical protein